MTPVATVYSGSSSSYHSSTTSYASDKPAPSRASSTSSIFDDAEEEDAEVVTVEGLPHVALRLEAKKYKTPAFAERVFTIVCGLHIPSWAGVTHPTALKIAKVSGSLTNAVFFVSCPGHSASTASLSSARPPKTLLLRIYGPSSGALISRPRELHTLHALSSTHRIGPRVYGTFENGRLEEYFAAAALTAADLREPRVSAWIGARMAELHCVDVDEVERAQPPPSPKLGAGPRAGEDARAGPAWEIAARANVRAWLAPAAAVLALPALSEAVRRAVDLPGFADEWARYNAWLEEFEAEHGASKRVFAHNDAQYGNLLRLNNAKEGLPEHRQIIVVDFEYAAPNPAAFDIANHFHEWTADYHGATPHILRPARYPTPAERRTFYRAYLTHACPPLTTEPDSANPAAPDADAEKRFAQLAPAQQEAALRTLDAQVRAWSPASHAMWAVWGLVQAREDVEGAAADAAAPEFDYIGYACRRLELFRRELRGLGL